MTGQLGSSTANNNFGLTKKGPGKFTLSPANTNFTTSTLLNLLYAGPTTVEGGILEIAQPMPVGKVMVVCPRCDRPTRVGHALGGDGRSVRVCRHCNEQIEVQTLDREGAGGAHHHGQGQRGADQQTDRHHRSGMFAGRTRAAEMQKQGQAGPTQNDSAEQQTFRASRIVNSLLSLAHPGQAVEAHEPVDLHPLIREVCAQIEQLPSTPRVRVRCELGDEALVVGGVAYQLQQVLLNLLKNAVEAMRDAACGEFLHRWQARLDDASLPQYRANAPKVGPIMHFRYASITRVVYY